MTDATFGHNWRAEMLTRPPLIAPARQFTWPVAIPGEEDAMARGALQVMVTPGEGLGAPFLANCALGFTDPSMPRGVWSCPDPAQICAVAGGYAYIAKVSAPDKCTQVALRPVVAVHPAAEAGLLLFVGFRTIVAWGAEGLAWETERLSWDGLRAINVDQCELTGLGWDLVKDEEVPFRIDLCSGAATGGAYRSG